MNHIIVFPSSRSRSSTDHLRPTRTSQDQEIAIFDKNAEGFWYTWFGIGLPLVTFHAFKRPLTSSKFVGQDTFEGHLMHHKP